MIRSLPYTPIHVALALVLASSGARAEPGEQTANASDSPSVALPAPDGAPAEAVPLDDLNLARADDLKRLVERIKAAAQDVCQRQGIEVLRRLQQERECRDIAFARGMAQVQSLIRADRVANR